jgi:hypothetical protein
MNKKLTLSLAASIALLALPAVHAAQSSITTSEILEYCKGTGGSFVTCEIYGQAVYDTYLYMSGSGQALKTICVNQPAPSRTEVIQGYVKWAQGSAEYAKEPAAQTMMQYLVTRFPCSKAN